MGCLTVTALKFITWREAGSQEFPKERSKQKLKAWPFRTALSKNLMTIHFLVPLCIETDIIMWVRKEGLGHLASKPFSKFWICSFNETLSFYPYLAVFCFLSPFAFPLRLLICTCWNWSPWLGTFFAVTPQAPYLGLQMLSTGTLLCLLCARNCIVQ